MILRRRVPVVAVLVALALVADLVIAGAVYLDRRDPPALPTFRTASLAGIDWDVSPYAGRTSAFGFTAEPAPPAEVSPSGTIDYRGQVNPALNAAYALACLDRARRDPRQRDVWIGRATTSVDQVLVTAPDGLLPYRLEDSDPFGDPLPVPGYSALSQGLMLSALAALHEETGDPRWVTAAQPVFRGLALFRGFFRGSLPAPEPWLAVVDDGHLWFEHFTHTRAPVRSVPEQLFAVIGLYDYRRVLAPQADRPTASRLLAGGLSTLLDAIPQVRRRGRLAYASLSAGTSDTVAHQQVETGVAVLGRILGKPSYETLSRQLDRDDNLAPFRTVRVRLDRSTDPFSPLPPGFGYAVAPPPGERLARGVVVRPDGTTDPAATATYALAAVDRYRSTGDEAWLRRAELAMRTVGRASLIGLAPYHYADADALGVALPIPWYSADAQGLLLAAAVQLADVTGDRRWRDTAAGIFATLQRFRDFGADLEPPLRPWTSLVDDSGYLWFEAYPSSSPPSLVLHVHLSTTLGVYAYWRLTGDPLARQMLFGAVTTLEHYLPIMRRAGRAWDSLAARSPDPQSERLVETQLGLMADITGDRRLAAFAAPRP